jgi:hypothetical protein
MEDTTLTQTIERTEPPANGYTPATEFHVDSEDKAYRLLRKLANLSNSPAYNQKQSETVIKT